jgi:hypothetical protein
MALATWWTGDQQPDLKQLAGFSASVAHDDHELARLNRIPVAEVRARQADGHRAYIGRVEGAPVTYGWVATRAAAIGELELAFTLPARELYPRLLQAILAHESRDADRLWIIHAPENLPSGAGMSKAGFEPVGTLSFDVAGRVSLKPGGADERASAGAALLGVPLIAEALAPCWHCSIGSAETDDSSCWPAEELATICTCATVPRPSVALVQK